MQVRGFRRPLRRLVRPLIRRGRHGPGTGHLEPASWDEAAELVARRWAEIGRAHGPDAFCCLSCSKASNELNYVAQKFVRAVVGTNNIDSCNRT